MTSKKGTRGNSVRVILNSENYEIANGRKPSGRGPWIFLLSSRTHDGNKTVTSRTIAYWTSDLHTFAAARAEAIAEAASTRRNYAELLWVPNVERVATSLKCTVGQVGRMYEKNAAQMRVAAKRANNAKSGLYLGRNLDEWDARAFLFEYAADRAEKITAALTSKGGAK